MRQLCDMRGAAAFVVFVLIYVVSSADGNGYEAKDFFGNLKKSASNVGDQCFCKLEGRIDDCSCSVDTVDYFNNMKIFPRLQSLLQKPYFRYFHYNGHKPCPFWQQDLGKCSSSNCGIMPCTPEELPPGLKEEHNHHHVNKYSKEAQLSDTCDDGSGSIDSSVDSTISASVRESLQRWKDHDESINNFCEIDAEQCPDCDHVDLALNPERFTGYSGLAAHRIWKAIYEENCFAPTDSSSGHLKGKGGAAFSAAFLQDKLDDMCLEKRAFYRAISGLHTSISVHLCANFLKAASTPFGGPATDQWGPNLEEFQRRFDPELTNGQGPYWLRNLYFVYLLELRALTKAAPYLEKLDFYTGRDAEDKETQIAVKELLNLMRSFPDHFDETTMFNPGSDNSVELKREFQMHFLNISRVMDCVGCDKCRLWGKLQVTGLGTALKILFSDSEPRAQPNEGPASVISPTPDHDYQLTRNEVVSLMNALGRLSTSIQELEKFREMLK